MNKYKLILVCCAFLVACQDRSMSDLKQFVNTAYKDRKPEIEPLPEIKPFEGFVYSASDEVDPFNRANIETRRQKQADNSGKRPDQNRRKEPLEYFTLDGLKMVGTLTQKDQPWVIIKAPDGAVHRATVGQYMGKNDGKITAILLEQQEVLLTELVQDPSGRWVDRKVSITIDE